MRWYRRKWIVFAAMTLGTTWQLSNCGTELSLLGLRSAFSSITLPINILLRNLLLGIV